MVENQTAAQSIPKSVGSDQTFVGNDPRAKKFQIFVSATLQDLEEERRAAIETILMMGHIPVGMELFQAGNDEQWNYIKKRIDQCDYYVVIIAQRYGSRTKEGISYTQKEYEYARSIGVPLAAFLLANNARKSWPIDRCEPDASKEIEKFRELAETRIVQYWTDKNELAVKCMAAINNLIVDYPRTGWVSADHAASIQVLTEFSRLSAENDELKKEIDELKSQFRYGERAEDIEDELKLFFISDSKKNINRMRAPRRKDILNNKINRKELFQILSEISAFDALRANCSELVTGCHPSIFGRNVFIYVSDEAKNENAEKISAPLRDILRHSLEDLSSIFIDVLVLKNVIEEKRKTTAGREHSFFYLTEIGRKIGGRMVGDLY